MLTESGPHVKANNRPQGLNRSRATMRLPGLRIIAAAFGAAMLLVMSDPVFAQSTDPKAAEKQQTGDGKDIPKKIDEFAEAEKVLGGPAANPECLWLGRRAVSLLWRDDLDTAFRHLDLYDRFGCPTGHVQATFRCLVRQGSIDPKATDTLNSRVHACWINPTAEAKGSASAPSATTNR
jgi:hypothetical protein